MALSRWSQLQQTPYVSPTRGPVGGSTGTQLRRLTEAYGQASRLLTRQARRGDAGSALQAIKVREEALNQGIQVGGIRRKDEYDAGILDRVKSMEQGSALRERADYANRLRVEGDIAEAEGRLNGEGNLDRISRMTEDAADARYANDVAPQPATRTGAALDILEGAKSGDVEQEQRGFTAARGLGVANPTSVYQGNRDLRYRRTLDSALGAARSPDEVAVLRQRGTKYGIPAADFDRRASWWERQRKA